MLLGVLSGHRVACRVVRHDQLTRWALGLPKWGMLLRGPMPAPGPNMGKPSCRGPATAPERGNSMADTEWRMPREVTPPDMWKG